MKRPLVLLIILSFVASTILFGSGCSEAVSEEDTAAESTAVVDTSADTVAEAEVEATTDAEEDLFSEPKELIFWWYGEDEVPGFTEYIEGECAAYNELHPNITVTPVHQGVDAVVPNFLAAAEANSGPDIATMWLGLYQLEQFWAGYAAPISDYVGEEELSHWYGKSLSEYDGKIWASDLFGFSFVVVYNKDHFRDAGLDPEKPPVTWAEFMDASGKLKATGHDPFSAGFAGGWEMAVLTAHMYPQYLSLNDIKESVVGTKHFNDPEFLDVWVKLDEYNKAGYFIKSATSIDFVNSWFEWRSGNATFCTFSSPIATKWVDELGTDKVGIMSFPQLTDNPAVSVPANPFSQFITAWSPNKELAADFLVFLHTEESFRRMVSTVDGRAIPVDDRFDPSIIGNPVKREVAIEVIEGIKNSKFFTDALIPYAIMGDGMIPAGQSLILQDISPQEAADMMEQTAEEWRSLNPEYVENYKKWIGIE